MDTYQKTYCYLFNKLTDIIDELKKIQAEAEEIFLMTEPGDDMRREIQEANECKIIE